MVESERKIRTHVAREASRCGRPNGGAPDTSVTVTHRGEKCVTSSLSSSRPSAAGGARRFRPATAAALLLLGLMGFLAGGAARRGTRHVDEVAHIGAGVSYIQKLDRRFNEEHPPLAKVLAAIPLVLGGTHADYGHVFWTHSTKFMPHAFLAEWLLGNGCWSDGMTRSALWLGNTVHACFYVGSGVDGFRFRAEAGG